MVALEKKSIYVHTSKNIYIYMCVCVLNSIWETSACFMCCRITPQYICKLAELSRWLDTFINTLAGKETHHAILEFTSFTYYVCITYIGTWRLLIRWHISCESCPIGVYVRCTPACIKKFICNLSLCLLVLWNRVLRTSWPYVCTCLPLRMPMIRST